MSDIGLLLDVKKKEIWRYCDLSPERTTRRSVDNIIGRNDDVVRGSARRRVRRLWSEIWVLGGGSIAAGLLVWLVCLGGLEVDGLGAARPLLLTSSLTDLFLGHNTIDFFCRQYRQVLVVVGCVAWAVEEEGGLEPVAAGLLILLCLGGGQGKGARHWAAFGQLAHRLDPIDVCENIVESCLYIGRV